ncbi:MAG: M24 family metallopeptidase [Clostridia bacterium]|nr:M24 family metallopeptidase [Clostridia bacterium]
MLPEVQRKLDKVRQFMGDRGVEAMVYQQAANFAWITAGESPLVNQGSEQGVASVVITGDSAYALTNNIESVRLREDMHLEDKGFEIVESPWHEGPPDCLKYAVRGATGADTLMNGSIYLGDMAAPLRYQLEPEEMDRFRWLGAHVGRAVEDAARCVEPGMTEHKAASLMAVRLYEAGIVPVVTLVAADGRAVVRRHPTPTDARLDKYAMLVACGRKWGLVASATRIVSIGPLPDDIRRKRDAAAYVDATAIAATKPQTRVADVFAAIVRAYSNAGFPDEWRFHHQGGAAGYQSREYLATPCSEQVVGACQAFAWNPSVAGTKSEDTIIVTDGRTEIITATGDWPVRTVLSESGEIARPDILVR